MLARWLAHKPPSPISAGHRSGLPSPTSPLEHKPLCPKGWKKEDSDVVGLSMAPKLEAFAGEQRGILLVCSEESYGGNPSAAAAGESPVADFLSCCNLCKKRLQGKDIYMYRGEKAFCSRECRYEQIVTDELLNKNGRLMF